MEVHGHGDRIGLSRLTGQGARGRLCRAGPSWLRSRCRRTICAGIGRRSPVYRWAGIGICRRRYQRDGRRIDEWCDARSRFRSERSLHATSHRTGPRRHGAHTLRHDGGPRSRCLLPRARLTAGASRVLLYRDALAGVRRRDACERPPCASSPRRHAAAGRKRPCRLSPTLTSSRTASAQ